jgi:hypothetical protein
MILFSKYVRYRLVNQFRGCPQIHEDVSLRLMTVVSVVSSVVAIVSTAALKHQYWVQHEYRSEGAHDVIQVFVSPHHTTYVNTPSAVFLLFIY